MIKVLSLSCVVLSLSMSGCGDDPTEVSELIVADAGGSLALGESVLEIPASALDVDTQVTMRLDALAGLPALAGGYPEVLTIEPAATSLALPGTLTLALGGPVVAGETVAAFHLVDGGWVTIEGAEVSGGLFQTSITSLGTYALTRRTVQGDGNRIEGVVRWGDDSPAGDVPIELHQGASVVADTVTDAQGGFSFVDLSPGAYQLVITFECNLEQAVTVTAEAPTEVELVLCGF